MKSITRCARAVAFAAISLVSAPALADVTLFGDRATFSSMGTIAENYGFEDIDTVTYGLAFQSDPWLLHDVTYTTGKNLILGPTSGVGLTSNVLTENYDLTIATAGKPLSGSIGGQYSLFGFELGNFNGTDTATVVLTTNLGTHTFTDIVAPYIWTQPAMSFVGFSASGGEYFTAFSITPKSISHAAMDNVTLGFASAVPEPSSYAFLMAGLGFLGFRARRRGHS